jgi:hypothetical protein
MERTAAEVLPVIKMLGRDDDCNYERIAIPFTDGIKRSMLLQNPRPLMTARW